MTFELRNYADALRYAEEDISYAVYVKNGDKYINAENELVDAGEEPPLFANGTLKTGKTNHATITLSGLTPGTYEITATGDAGYQETLTATFKVSEAEAGVYKYVDAEDDYYVLLTVWTENVAGEVSISCPGGLIPDNTDPAMKTAKTGGTIADTTSFTSAYSSHTYRFFKQTVGDENFDAGDFTVKVNTTTAKEKTLD